MNAGNAPACTKCGDNHAVVRIWGARGARAWACKIHFAQEMGLQLNRAERRAARR